MGTLEFHSHRRPHWWARISIGPTKKTISLPLARGDRPLDCIVALFPGTIVQVGIGMTTRETVVTTEIGETAAGP